ncbi:MAG: fibronectin type III domain-containing protein [Eggerthellaceae bacterium]|nr:fibronectin type III domain-containing protein [Eggerthellaceae bacterium]
MQPSIMTNTAASYAQTVTATGKMGALKNKAVAAPKITSLAAGQKKVTAKWSKVSSATKYQLSYSENKSMKGAKTASVAKLKTSCTIKALASGKRCYVQVRAFRSIGGHAYYSAWSGKKSAVVK